VPFGLNPWRDNFTYLDQDPQLLAALPVVLPYIQLQLRVWQENKPRHSCYKLPEIY
jgi:hypothetical protein